MHLPIRREAHEGSRALLDRSAFALDHISADIALREHPLDVRALEWGILYRGAPHRLQSAIEGTDDAGVLCAAIAAVATAGAGVTVELTELCVATHVERVVQEDACAVVVVPKEIPQQGIDRRGQRLQRRPQARRSKAP